MTFALDPYCDWESEWERKNPEPHGKPAHLNMKGDLVWRSYEVLDRIAWHAARWEAYKKKFPDWVTASYGTEKDEKTL